MRERDRPTENKSSPREVDERYMVIQEIKVMMWRGAASRYSITRR